jgi:hypothetical protein
VTCRGAVWQRQVGTVLVLLPPAGVALAVLAPALDIGFTGGAVG